MALPGEIEPPLSLRASRFASWVYTMMGDQERASAYANAAVELAQQLGDAAGNVTTLNTLGAIAFHRGDFVQAQRRWEEALERAGAPADPRLLAGIYNNLGVVAGFLGNIEQAQHFQEQSLALNRELGARSDAAGNLDNLAHLACGRGDADRAAELVVEALAIYLDVNHRGGVADTLGSAAEVAQIRASPDLAARFLAAANAQRSAIAFVPPPYQQEAEQAILAWSKQELGADAFAAASNAGASALISELVALIEGLRRTDASTLRPTGPTHAGLTPREVEIVRLLVDGLSNQQIADALSISLRTAQTHVANILNKLGLGSRTAVAAYAVRHGLA